MGIFKLVLLMIFKIVVIILYLYIEVIINYIFSWKELLVWILNFGVRVFKYLLRGIMELIIRIKFFYLI